VILYCDVYPSEWVPEQIKGRWDLIWDLGLGGTWGNWWIDWMVVIWTSFLALTPVNAGGLLQCSIKIKKMYILNCFGNFKGDQVTVKQASPSKTCSCHELYSSCLVFCILLTVH